jgi:hypothetical protein
MTFDDVFNIFQKVCDTRPLQQFEVIANKRYSFGRRIKEEEYSVRISILCIPCDSISVSSRSIQEIVPLFIKQLRYIKSCDASRFVSQDFDETTFSINVQFLIDKLCAEWERLEISPII